MNVEKLYRNRLQAVAILAVLALISAAYTVFFFRQDPDVGVWHVAGAWFATILLAVAAALAFVVARMSYRLDRGGIGDEEWREIVRAGEEWEKRGYRTPEEIAAGVPPRKEPPDPAL